MQIGKYSLFPDPEVIVFAGFINDCKLNIFAIFGLLAKRNKLSEYVSLGFRKS